MVSRDFQNPGKLVLVQLHYQYMPCFKVNQWVFTFKTCDNVCFSHTPHTQTHTFYELFTHHRNASVSPLYNSRVTQLLQDVTNVLNIGELRHRSDLDHHWEKLVFKEAVWHCTVETALDVSQRNKCSAQHIHSALIIATAEFAEHCSLRPMSMAH